MSNISFNLSGKIDAETVQILQAIKEIADSLDIHFFVVGATARDIILEHCYNVTPRRMSLDIDIGVEVADWDQFNELFNALLSSGKFSDSKERQRILFNSRPVDIVPFGSVADKNKTILWPPEYEILMSILGFEESCENSITVRINDDPVLDIKCPTLSGLAIMKLISWDEKYPNRSKDAEDFLFIMTKYDHAGNTERLYEMEPELLEDSAFDTTEAGIRLLGRDMASIADTDTLAKVNEILDKETGEQDRYRLVIDMIKGSIEYDDRFDHILNLLNKLNQGVSEVGK